MWPTEGPTAAERDVETQSQFASFIGGEAQSFKKLIGKIRKIVKSGSGIVQSQRINRLHFDAANTGLFHGLQFAFKLSIVDSGPKPPPAHHDSRISRRILETGPEFRDAVGLRVTERCANS